MKNRLSLFLLLFICLSMCCSCFSGEKKTVPDLSAYDVAVANGYTGSAEEWLQSLRGKSAYDLWLENGNVGSVDDFLASLSTTVNTYSVHIDSEDERAAATAKSMLSVVSVYSNFSKTYYSYSFVPGRGYVRNEETEDYQAAGSGVIYSLDKEKGDAYVITNYHVIYDKNNTSTDSGVSADISLYLYGQEFEPYAIPATYVGGSMYYDIAVLRIKNSDVLRTSAATAAELLPEDEEIIVGQTAIAVGNPEAYGISVTSGIVCVDSEYITMTTSDGSAYVKMRVHRIDTAINSGNSGGGLFDSKGRLIGITNAKMVASSTENIAYAIPIRVAERVADNIIDYCADGSFTSVRRAMIGVTVETASSSAVYDAESGIVSIRETVRVSAVNEGSVAENKVLVGDIVTSLSIGETEYPVTRTFMLIDAMLCARIGDTVTLHLIRDGIPTDVHLFIGESCVVAY